MLVDPSLDDLLTKVDSKFKLVTLALKRARQINSGTFLDGYNAAKPVSMALQEINRDEVFVKDAETETEDKEADSESDTDFDNGTTFELDS